MLTVRAPNDVVDRLQRLDSTRLLLFRDGPAAFVVAGPDADVDELANVDALWHNRLRPFAEALVTRGPMRARAELRPYDPG